MFCTYCGKEVQEQQACECQKSIQSSKPILKWKKIILEFIQNPIHMMKRDYDISKFGDRMLAGYTFAGIFFACAVLALIRPLGSGDAFKYAFMLVLFVSLIKTAFAGAMFIFSKNNGADFKNILAEVCYATIPQSVCMIMIALFSLLGFYSGVALMIGLYLVFMVVMGVVTMEVIFEENKGIGFWVLIVFSIITMVVLAFVGKQMITSLLKSVMDNLMGYIWNY